MKKIYSLILLAAALICLPWSAKAQLTVADGTANNAYIPVYGTYADWYQRTQFIYPSSLLTALKDNDITALTFYLQTKANAKWTGTFQVTLLETDEETYAMNEAPKDITSGVVVYTGELDGTGETMTINFSSEFSYGGKNLLVDIQTNTLSSNSPAARFYGISDANYDNRSFYGYNSSSIASINKNRSYFTPKTTFTYEAGGIVTCPKPTDLTKGTILANSASFSWTKGGDETEWLYLCVEADAAQDWSSATKVTSPSVTVEGLTGTTDYKFYLRALCGEGDTSKIINTAFSTPCETIKIDIEHPFEQDFAGLAEIPACWDVAGIKQATINGNYSYIDEIKTNTLFFPGKSTSYDYVMLPAFENAFETLQISFSHIAESSNNSGKVELGYYKDGTFTQLKVYAISEQTWKKEEAFELPNTIPSDARLAFACKANTSSGYATAIDDIMVELIPSCVKPKNIVALPTPEGAVITWEQGKEENEYEYACDVTGFTPSSWETVTSEGRTITVDGKMAGETYDFYLRSNCGTDGTSQAVKVSFTPECGAPSNVTTTALTAHEATIEWDAAALITQHQFVCVRQGGTPVWDEVVAQAVTSVTLDTLQAATSYDFYVRSFYSDGVQSTATKLTFTTNCDAVAIGWSESFDSSFPTCWSKANYYMWSSSYQWAPSTNEKKSGSYSILLRSYKYNNNAYSDLETPSIAISEKAVLAFYRLCTAEVPLTVLMKVNGVETQLATYSTAQSSWTATPTTINIPDTCVGKTISIIFRGNGAGSTYNRYLYLDDISINYQPAEVPTNLAAAPTADGAVISWENDEEGPWDLRYKEAEASEWTEVNGLTQKTYTLTGLSAEKSYDVQVRANCSANRQSAWTSSINFAPTCPTPSTIEFSNQTYNGATVTWTAGGGESMWNLRYKNADDADWTEVSDLTARTYNLENLITSKEYTVDVQASCNGEWASAVYTPAFVEPTFKADDVKDVSAKIEWENVEGAIAYKYALTTRGDAADWGQATQTGNTYAELNDLQALTEYDLHVKTVYASGESEAAYKQFATIAIAPNNLTLDEVKATSATFSWAKNGSAARQYQVVVAEGSAAPDWANATLTENDVLTATIDNLTPNTYYTFYVRAYYEADKVSDAVSNAFETPCAAVASFPWEEDFESVSVETIPACWDKSASTATPDWDDPSYIWTVYLHNAGGNNLLRLNNSMVNANGVAVINTPIFEIPASPAYDLTFSYAHTASCGEFAVLVSVDGGAFSNFTEPKSYDKTSESNSTSAPDGMTNAVISLADYAGKSVAFQFSATPDDNAGAIFIDNVKVAEHVNDGTAIGNTGSETKAVKAIENGHLIIIREGVKYNAQGKQL